MWQLVGFILGCEAVGILSAFISGTGNSAWYRSLIKPFWQPPSWLFGPAWTILYGLMGVSVYLIFKAPSSKLRTIGIILFAVQLILNFIWSPLFFRYHLLGIAFAEILLLLAVIIATTVVFFMIDRRAAYLLIPYILWVSFASTLNGAIWHLN